jgi:hypothetical protein
VDREGSARKGKESVELSLLLCLVLLVVCSRCCCCCSSSSSLARLEEGAGKEGRKGEREREVELRKSSSSSSLCFASFGIARSCV